MLKYIYPQVRDSCWFYLLSLISDLCFSLLQSLFRQDEGGGEEWGQSFTQARVSGSV